MVGAELEVADQAVGPEVSKFLALCHFLRRPVEVLGIGGGETRYGTIVSDEIQPIPSFNNHCCVHGTQI
jgi:hypothetical protein